MFNWINLVACKQTNLQICLTMKYHHNLKIFPNLHFNQQIGIAVLPSSSLSVAVEPRLRRSITLLGIMPPPWYILVFLVFGGMDDCTFPQPLDPDNYKHLLWIRVIWKCTYLRALELKVISKRNPWKFLRFTQWNFACLDR